MIERNDVDRDGKWSLEDFVEVMTGNYEKNRGSKRPAPKVNNAHPAHLPKMGWTGRFKQGKDWVDFT